MLPVEKETILLNNFIDVDTTELLANGAAVLVINDTGRLIHHLPASSPRLHAKVSVFKVERSKEMIEATNLKKLGAVKCRGSTPRIETRHRARSFAVRIVAKGEFSAAKIGVCQASFFTAFGRITKEDLCGNRKHFRIGERLKQWREEIAFDAHV